MEFRFLKPSALLGLSLLVLLLVASWPYYFDSPNHETGDSAANALQIDRAKRFEEIHGNYSRFHFNHPGPGFFYLYAWGEILLVDLLPIFPTPNNAHSFVGLATQVFFFSASLLIAARWIRHPLFLPAALMVTLLHFAAIDTAFHSIWPPNVILFPFLCFLLACASVSTGSGRDLVLAVVSGSFLVHGHVAQPLFVVPLFVIAYAFFLFHVPRPNGPLLTVAWRAYPRQHAWAAAALAVFLLPLVIDLFRGPDGNFNDILAHLRGESEDRKSWTQSALYLLFFLGYRGDHDYILESINLRTWGAVLESWPYFAGWIAIAVASTVLWVRRRSGFPAERAIFLARLLLFIGLTVPLVLVWGKMQAGPMVAFNGYFYHAIIAVALLFFVTVLLPSSPSPRLRRLLVPALYLPSAILAATALGREPIPRAGSGLELHENLRSALAADPKPEAIKHLVFFLNDWPEAVAAALALERRRIDYAVPPMWTFMFGKRRSFSHLIDPFPSERISVWRLGRSLGPEEGLPLMDDVRVRFGPYRIDPQQGEISFHTGGNSFQFIVAGFSTPEGDSSVADDPIALLHFGPLPAQRDIEVLIEAYPILFPHSGETQEAAISFNGTLLARPAISDETAVRLRISREVWNQHEEAVLRFDFPGAASPRALGLAGDPRILSWGFRRISFRYAADGR